MKAIEVVRRLMSIVTNLEGRVAALEHTQQRAPAPVMVAEEAPAPAKEESPSPPAPPPPPTGRDESRHSFHKDGRPKDEAELRRDGVDPNSGLRPDGSPKSSEELLEDARHPERFTYRGHVRPKGL